MPLVIDNSVTLAWCFTDEATEYTESVLDLLGETSALYPLSGRWKSPTYCCWGREGGGLAMRKGLPLAILDERLATAARQAGVVLVE